MGADERSSPLDLSAFRKATAEAPRLWWHTVRTVDRNRRVRLHEVVELVGFDGSNLGAVLRRHFWELHAGAPPGAGVFVDSEHRLVVPSGVAHQLALRGPVLVSLAADSSRIAISSTARIDSLLEAFT